MDDEKSFLPSEIPELISENTDSGELDLKDYLFEPDPSKIRDISDFDRDTGWIPRIDRFGQYVGDGILTPRKKIVKAVFNGFYEDLNENSMVSLINEKVLTFSNLNEKIKMRDQIDIVYVLCSNADVLYRDKEFTNHEAQPWITTNLAIDTYEEKEKFLVYCFEIIKLTHWIPITLN